MLGVFLINAPSILKLVLGSEDSVNDLNNDGKVFGNILGELFNSRFSEPLLQ